MLAGNLYLCESSGARILAALGQVVTQLGTDFQFSAWTWDQIPAGEAGDVYFRAIDVTIGYTNGFNVGIIPIIDGVEQPEQFFTGAGTDIQTLQAQVALRGSRIAAKVRSVSRAGTLDIQNIQAEHVIIRLAP